MCTKGLYQPLFVQAAARILPLRWGYNVYTFAEKKTGYGKNLHYIKFKVIQWEFQLVGTGFGDHN